MCLAIPGKVIETLEQDGIRMAKVSFSGVVKQVCVEYTPDARAGDYVLVHVGFAISKIDDAEAARVFVYLKEMDSDEIPR